jgi:hypothetical protein
MKNSTVSPDRTTHNTNTTLVVHVHQDSTFQDLREWADRDRISSGIPKDLWDANVQLLRGDDAIEYLLGDKLGTFGGHSQQFATKPVQRLLKQYERLCDGIWASRHGVPYAKPMNPRPDFYKPGKLIKYETAPGVTASPMLPQVDEATAAAIYARYEVRPQANESFWDVVRREGLPVAIAEGLKKALALIAHGMPAISIRGITQWHLKGGLELHPEIEQFATPGRLVYIFFDQDEKPKTIAAVHVQARKLGTVLDSKKARVFCPQWKPAEGKGIDDVLARYDGDAAGRLADIMAAAPTLKEYKRGGQVVAALNSIKRLNSLSAQVERDTEGEYMPQLPALTPGAIHVVDATMNTGKTFRIGRDWVQSALAEGHHVLVLSPLNSLGQQTAMDWGIAHIHDQGSGKEQREFWEAMQDKPGIVMCPDSIGKVPAWFWSKPVLLVLDEANQVTEHIAQGDTLKSRYAAVLGLVAEAAKHAIESGGAIVLSEDGIPDRAVKFWQSLSGAAVVRCFRHRKQGQPWDVSVFQGAVSGFRARLLQRAAQGDRLLIVTASQREAKRLEAILGEFKVVRIDSETNEGGAFNLFFKNPDLWLEVNEPDILILSPSAKSGVSIQGGIKPENAYFSEVWGYFPALATDTHLQLLGRYRPPVPRRLYVAPFILGDADEQQHSPQGIRKRLTGNLSTVAKLLELSTGHDELRGVEAAVLDYLSEARAVSGSQKVIARDALINRLELSGHHVNIIEVKGDKAAAAIWKDTQEQIWQAEALEIAEATIEDGQDSDWAYRTLDSMECTRADRIVAHKVLWRDEFPGVTFDEQSEVYQAITQDYGSMRRGVLTQARILNLETVKESDAAAAAAIFGSGVRAAHRLPKNYIKAAILDRLDVLSLVGGQSWTNRDPRCIAIKQKALRYADEIRYYLRLQIKPDQTPAEVANKLLRKLGLEAVVIARPGSRDVKRDRVYFIKDLNNPVRAKLLKAACDKLSGSVSTIRNRESIPIQITDTPLPDTPERSGGRGAGLPSQENTRASLCKFERAKDNLSSTQSPCVVVL